MTWSDARTALIAIPALVTPTVLGRGLTNSFRYDKAGHDDMVGTQSRRWWARALSGHSDGPTTNTITRHRLIWEIVVEYIDQLSDTGLIDEAIPSDAALLAIAFSSGSNWNRPTSNIVAITPISNQIAPYVIEQIPGARRLRIQIEVRYQQ